MNKPLQKVADQVKPGGFHESLGIPQDENVGEHVTEQVANAPVGAHINVHGHDVTVTSKIKKQAVLARTFQHAG